MPRRVVALLHDPLAVEIVTTCSPSWYSQTSWMSSALKSLYPAMFMRFCHASVNFDAPPRPL
jgi:hypothetical protein